MKQLNLVPESTRQKAAQIQLVPYLVIAVLVGIGAVFSLWFSVQIQRESTSERLDLLQSSLAQTNKTTTASLDTDTIARVTALNNLAKNDINWDSAFSLVESVTPSDVSLSSFSYVTTTSGVTISLVGIAPSNVSFAGFVQSLSDNKKFTSSQVTSYTYNPANGGVSFGVDILVPFDQLEYPSS